MSDTTSTETTGSAHKAGVFDIRNIIGALMGVYGIILTLAGLGFLGFGIEPSAASEWGYDLQKSLADVTSGIWWTALFPGLAITVLVLSTSVLGRHLQRRAEGGVR